MARIRRFSRVGRKSRFRRKARYTWFPVLGARFPDGEGNNYFSAPLRVGNPSVYAENSQGAVTSVYPITSDFTQFPGNVDTDNLDTSLRDFVEGQQWKLERLVGNVHLSIDGGNTEAVPNVWPYVLVGAGFFVARSSDEDQTFPDLFDDEIDVLGRKNIQNPWIWRKTWMLRNPDSLDTFGVSAIDWPQANNNYFDGGQGIDAKSVRVIRREQRLWFALSSMGYDPQRVDQPAGAQTQPYVHGVLDVRVLGRMLRGKNLSAF